MIYQTYPVNELSGTLSSSRGLDQLFQALDQLFHALGQLIHALDQLFQALGQFFVALIQLFKAPGQIVAGINPKFTGCIDLVPLG
jgi:hypothetical protein